MDEPPALPLGFTFSQSSLQDYTDCPRRFQLRYLDQLKWPAVETEPALENERSRQEGQLFHRLLQQHRIGLPAEKLAPLASTPDLHRWWENYIGYDFKLSGFAQHTELTLSAPVGTHRLLAKYDLVAIGPGEKVLIFDWKTYHRRPRDEWMAARMQTRVYRALLVQAGAVLNSGQLFDPKRIEMIYWYADFPNEPVHFPYNATLSRHDWEALTGLINEITNHRHFPMTADEKKCAFCPYRSYCNRGIKAGEGEELEAELAGLDINFEQVAEIEF